MTIDESVKNKIESVLAGKHYCSPEQVRKIVEEEIRGEFSHELQEVSRENERLLVMNDRMWDAIQKLAEPKFPKMRHFLHFRWLKFWRNWNWKFWSRNNGNV